MACSESLSLTITMGTLLCKCTLEVSLCRFSLQTSWSRIKYIRSNLLTHINRFMTRCKVGQQARFSFLGETFFFFFCNPSWVLQKVYRLSNFLKLLDWTKVILLCRSRVFMWFTAHSAFITAGMWRSWLITPSALKERYNFKKKQLSADVWVDM